MTPIEAAAEDTAAAISDYEKECVDLIESISISLRWTIAWLVGCFLFNGFLIYCNIVTCDKFKKVRNDLNRLQENLQQKYDHLTESVKLLIRLSTRMENDQLTDRIDRIVNCYNDGLNVSMQPGLNVSTSSSMLPFYQPSAPTASILATSTPFRRTSTPSTSELTNPMLPEAALQLGATAKSSSSRRANDLERALHRENEEEFGDIKQKRVDSENHLHQLKEIKHRLVSTFRRST